MLSVSDTSEINLQRYRGRIKREGVGVVGNNRDLGFWIHPSLMLYAESSFPLGLSHVRSWLRAYMKSSVSSQWREPIALTSYLTHVDTKRSVKYSSRFAAIGSAFNVLGVLSTAIIPSTSHSTPLMCAKFSLMLECRQCTGACSPLTKGFLFRTHVNHVSYPGLDRANITLALSK